MTKSILTILAILLIQASFSQSRKKNNQQEIQEVLNDFMKCLVQKDSVKFYALFHTDPVVWVGVTHQKTYAEELKKDSTARDSFKSNYKSFYRYFYNKEIEEKFYNIQIIENGYIATVMFDYSFWEKDKKSNWGKESWGMIKTKGKWKISSVLFSTEDQSIHPEPKQSKATRKIEE